MKTIPITVNIPIDDLSPEAIREAVIALAANRILGVTNSEHEDEDGNTWTQEHADYRDKMRREVEQAVERKVAEAVEAEVPATVREVLNGEFQPMDRWGNSKGQKTTIRDMVHDYAKTWLDQMVNERGDADIYRDDVKRTRLSWLVIHYVEETYKGELKAMVDATAAEIKPALRNKLADAVSETVSRLLGVAAK